MAQEEVHLELRKEVESKNEQEEQTRVWEKLSQQLQHVQRVLDQSNMDDSDDSDPPITRQIQDSIKTLMAKSKEVNASSNPQTIHERAQAQTKSTQTS